MTERERDQQAIELGMPYKLVIPGLTPLYLRTAMEIGPLMREMYPEVAEYTVIDVRL